ncbi:Hypothetical predicted protein [Xyrichtys novacula]|uniref:Uncharacterized protein n=1 Tax=Xyrichtys novacula TaxID=13765 RepID=A0AAV1GZN5_XYRNO|nr:Hypothetical predicted protein [Xyrichtys novacula]
MSRSNTLKMEMDVSASSTPAQLLEMMLNSQREAEQSAERGRDEATLVCLRITAGLDAFPVGCSVRLPNVHFVREEISAARSFNKHGSSCLHEAICEAGVQGSFHFMYLVKHKEKPDLHSHSVLKMDMDTCLLCFSLDLRKKKQDCRFPLLASAAFAARRDALWMLTSEGQRFDREEEEEEERARGENYESNKSVKSGRLQL